MVIMFLDNFNNVKALSSYINIESSGNCESEDRWRDVPIVFMDHIRKGLTSLSPDMYTEARCLLGKGFYLRFKGRLGDSC